MMLNGINHTNENFFYGFNIILREHIIFKVQKKFHEECLAKIRDLIPSMAIKNPVELKIFSLYYHYTILVICSFAFFIHGEKNIILCFLLLEIGNICFFTIHVYIFFFFIFLMRIYYLLLIHQAQS